MSPSRKAPCVTCTVARQFRSFSSSTLAVVTHTHQSPCLASQAWAELLKDPCKHNLQLRVGDKQFCTLLLFTHKRHKTCDRIAFESMSTIARLQESVPQVSYLGMPSCIIFQKSLLPARLESQIMSCCWLT